jgi:hypothetical protein
VSKIQFQNGQTVEFDGNPSPQDVDYVAKQLKIPSFVGGAKSPANIQAQGNLKKAQQQDSASSVFDQGMKKTADRLQQSTRALPFGNTKMPINPRNIIGEIAKAGSFALGPMTGGASYMAGQSLEDKDNILKMAGKTALGAVGGKVLSKGMELTGKAIQKMVPKPVIDRIYHLYNSAIGGSKAKNIGELGTMKNSRVGAMKAISDNLPQIKLQNPETGQMESRAPQNRIDLARAFNQTKQLIWKKVSSLSKGATDRGAVINIRNIAEQAKKQTLSEWGKEAVNTTRRNEAAHLDSLIPLYSERGNPTDAEALMKTLFADSKGVENGPTYALKDFYRNFQEKLSEQTDKTIEETLEKSGYKAYRQQYAQLKSAEKEIVNAANKYNRTVGAGGISHPFVNLWSLEDAMQGVAEGAMGNPVGGAFKIARGAAIKGASKLSDHLMSPDRRISEMFRLISKHAPDESVLSGIEDADIPAVGKLYQEKGIAEEPVPANVRTPQQKQAEIRKTQAEKYKQRLEEFKKGKYRTGIKEEARKERLEELEKSPMRESWQRVGQE